MPTTTIPSPRYDLCRFEGPLVELITKANRSHQSMTLAGVGPVELDPCPACRGLGREEIFSPEPEVTATTWAVCGTCAGTGEIATCVDDLENLRRALKDAYRQVRELQTHRHEWDRGDDERAPTRCAICGANGDV